MGKLDWFAVVIVLLGMLPVALVAALFFWHERRLIAHSPVGFVLVEIIICRRGDHFRAFLAEVRDPASSRRG